MISYISTMLTPSVKKADGKSKCTDTLKRSSSILSSSQQSTNITPNVSPIEKIAGSSSSPNLSTSGNSGIGSYSIDATFLHILERITTVEQQNSKLRLENDLLEKRMVALTNNNKQQDDKIATMVKELADQGNKYDSQMKNMNNLLHFTATENAMLLGNVKNEILDYVNSTLPKADLPASATLSTSDSASDSTTDSTSEPTSESPSSSTPQNSNGTPVVAFETLQEEFVSLCHDNVALNTKIDNLHEENIFLKNQVDVVLSRVRELAEEDEKIHEEIDSIVHTQISHNTSQLETNLDAHLRGEIKLINERVYEVEKEVYKTNQYNRRQNLIIEGIPNKIPQRDLERTAVNIIHQLGFPVQFRDVVGCHRLHKPSNDPTVPTPTIIRFTNRKVTEFCIQNSRYLSKIRLPWRITVREDLCESNDYIVSQCELLKKRGVINHFMIRNGFVKTVRKRGEVARKVIHPDDLKSMFPDAFM